MGWRFLGRDVRPDIRADVCGISRRDPPKDFMFRLLFLCFYIKAADNLWSHSRSQDGPGAGLGAKPSEPFCKIQKQTRHRLNPFAGTETRGVGSVVIGSSFTFSGPKLQYPNKLNLHPLPCQDLSAWGCASGKRDAPATDMEQIREEEFAYQYRAPPKKNKKKKNDFANFPGKSYGWGGPKNFEPFPKNWLWCFLSCSLNIYIYIYLGPAKTYKLGLA